MTRRHVLIISSLAVVFAVAGFFLHQADYPLTYDEGDYYIAVQRGFWTNWTDHDDLSIVEFVSMGLDAVGDADARVRLSNYIRESGSTMFLRHYHPPLAYYPAIALSGITGGLPLQWQLRLSNLFWILLWISVLTVLAWKREDARTPLIAVLPASAAYAMAVVGFNMHLPFGLMFSLFLYCLYLYERGGGATMLRLAQFFFAATLVSVAYGMFVTFFLVLLLLWRYYKAGDRRAFLLRVLKSVGWVMLFMLLLWPAAIINLNLLKNWVFTIYIGLFRISAEAVVFDNWVDLLFGKWNSSPLELLLLLSLIAFLVLRPRLLLRYGSVFIAAGVILALLYLQTNPSLVYRWYLFPAFAAALFFLTEVATRELAWSWTRNTGIVAGISVLLFAVAFVAVAKPDYSELIQLHRLVRSEAPASMTVPRSVYPQLRPYYPDAVMTSIHDVAYENMSVADSISVWKKRGLVIVPRAAFPHDNTADAETENYLLYREAGK